MNTARLLTIGLYLCVALALCTSTAAAQQWVAIYDGSAGTRDEPRGIALDKNGNVLVSGTIVNQDGHVSYAMLKYDSVGSLTWDHRLVVPIVPDLSGCHELVPAVMSAPRVDTAGNIYFVGKSPVFSVCVSPWDGGYYSLRKLSPGNSVLLDLGYALPDYGARAPVMEVDPDGNIYVCGSGASQGKAILLLKYNAAGLLAWEKVWGDTPWSGGRIGGTALRLDGLGNIVASGVTADSTTEYDALTIKCDTAGNLLWQRQFDSLWAPAKHGSETPTDVCLDGAQNIYLSVESYVPGAGEKELLLKYDSAGNLLWSFETEIQDAEAMEMDGSGNVYLAGLVGYRCICGGGEWAPCDCTCWGGGYILQKHDPTGALQWERRYDHGDSLSDHATDLAVDSAGSVFVTGTMLGDVTCDGFPLGGNLATAIGTLKYDSDGNLVWHHAFSMGFVNEAWFTMTDGSGGVFVAGIVRDSVDEMTAKAPDIITMKYTPCGMTLAPYGDMNSNDVITSADIIYLVAYIFKGGPPPPICAVYGDVQCDGSVTSADVIYMVNHVFKSGSPPCGDDPCSHPLAGTCL